jgi:hypothetical protein
MVPAVENDLRMADVTALHPCESFILWFCIRGPPQTVRRLQSLSRWADNFNAPTIAVFRSRA